MGWGWGQGRTGGKVMCINIRNNYLTAIIYMVLY